jgi:hypothetical protein
LPSKALCACHQPPPPPPPPPPPEPPPPEKPEEPDDTGTAAASALLALPTVDDTELAKFEPDQPLPVRQ